LPSLESDLLGERSDFLIKCGGRGGIFADRSKGIVESGSGACCSCCKLVEARGDFFEGGAKGRIQAVACFLKTGFKDIKRGRTIPTPAVKSPVPSPIFPYAEPTCTAMCGVASVLQVYSSRKEKEEGASPPPLSCWVWVWAVQGPCRAWGLGCQCWQIAALADRNG
jgi:hypothetical protein